MCFPFFYKFIDITGLGKYAGKFEDTPLFVSNVGELKNHAALALPGVGIFIHPDDEKNISLLRHEYGHMLQAKRWGMFFFYRTIALTSLNSARRSNQDPHFIHQHTWTEWTANKLSYDFLKQPPDWDMRWYPIAAPVTRREGSEVPGELVIGNQ